MQRKKQRNKYMLVDFFMSALGVGLFYLYRRYFIDTMLSEEVISPFTEFKFYLELVLVPVFWIFVFYISGYYELMFNKSRITEFVQTLTSVLVGSVILFFVMVLDDGVSDYKNYYLILFMLFATQFVCVYTLRLYITHQFHVQLYNGDNGLRTLIVGDVAEGVSEADSLPRHLGNEFVGVVMGDSRVKGQIVNGYTCFGTYDELGDIIKTHKIEEVVLGLKKCGISEIQKILNILYRRNIHIKVIPDVYEKLIGSAKLTPIYGCAMMEISHDIISPFQMRLKRLMDVVISSVMLSFLLPYFIYVMIRVVLDSKGAPLFRQERIGKDGKPFTMYKFRSMKVRAENEKPLLTMPDDARITTYGSFMRKYRIDELPQLWNVLIGDMAIVGPRPERQFFIDRMVASEPDYFFLQKIRPGITSLGMVKFGYADNVDKMLKRFKYDLIYLENMSLMLDLKVLYYTFFVIVTGKGV